MPALGLGLGTKFYRKVGGFKGLLDLYGGSAAAYSLERLAKDTTNVVRVRRSSDDTEQDFTAAQVSDGTLTTFTGAGDGFVRTWYDQSGNARHAQQTTAASQPQIVSGGALVGGLDFDGVNDTLQTSALPTGTFDANSISMHFVTNRNANVSNARMLHYRSGTPGFEALDSSGNNPIYYRDSGGNGTVGDSLNAGSALDSDQLLSVMIDRDVDQLISGYLNGAAVVNASETDLTGVGSVDATARPLTIGSQATVAPFYNGKIRAIIAYPLLSDRVAIEADLAEIYGITLA